MWATRLKERPVLRLVLCAVLAGLIFAVLMLPWPGLRAGYASVFRPAQEAVLGSMWDKAEVRFRAKDLEKLPEGYPLPPNINMADTNIYIIPKNGRGHFVSFNSSRQIGYIPTAVFVALVLATPVPARRKPFILLIGLALLYGYIFLRVGLFVFNWLAGPEGLGLYSLSDTTQRALAYSVNNILPAGTYVVPVFLWILLSFRRGDLGRLLGRR